MGPGDVVFAASVAVDGGRRWRRPGNRRPSRAASSAWPARRRGSVERPWKSRPTASWRVSCRLWRSIALASALGWGLLGGDWARGGLAALSVLVVACPCALGIATPMATTIAITRAAGRGIRLRSGAVLEALDPRPSGRFFDKTGVIDSRASGPCAGCGSTASGTCPSRTSSAFRLRSRRPSITRSHWPSFPAPEAGASRFRQAREIHAVAGGGAGGRVGSHRVLIGSRSLLGREGVLRNWNDSMEARAAARVRRGD